MSDWKVTKIGVIGPGIVGMPMAALLANAKIKIGTDEAAQVVVVQRNSFTSGWKVEAINEGRSVIGGIEPALNQIVLDAVSQGLLSASHDYEVLNDADVILVCVQTDKSGVKPDYGPLMGALTKLAETLQNRSKDQPALIIFESTLAPSTMQTVIIDHFKKYNLYEGRDVLLGNSPNRVMPGRLVQRVVESDKLVAGLQTITAKRIKELYSHIVTVGTLFETNSLTAEIEKTLENAYRDVRIAFSSEVAQYCDEKDIDFYELRDKVNELLSQTDQASKGPNVVPKGGLLIPTIGVGGHCLPKDGVLLWWRKIERGDDTSKSLILKSREINNSSPARTIQQIEKKFGNLNGRNIALLGTAYRFNSEDTRNSPSLQLANLLKAKNCNVKLHDPFVKTDDQNIRNSMLTNEFTNDLEEAISEADCIIMCTAHQFYIHQFNLIASLHLPAKALFDGCNIFQNEQISMLPFHYAGIGRGKLRPGSDFVNEILEVFSNVERGVANEVLELISFYNNHFVHDDFNRAKFDQVQMLASTCSTGCHIVDPLDVEDLVSNYGIYSELARLSVQSYSPITE